MLFKAAQAFHTSNVLLHQSTASFSTGKFKLDIKNPHVEKSLLYPFNEKNTQQALNILVQNTNPLARVGLEDLIVLDKLTQTASSQTNRVFDTHEKKFFAMNTISLDSTQALKQVNLMMRINQRQSHLLPKVHSFTKDSVNQEVKIFTEIQNTLLNDFAHLQRQTKESWSVTDLKILLLQMLRQMQAVNQYGAHEISLKPEHMFVDTITNSLKLYNFSGFEVSKRRSIWPFSSSFNTDVALHCLVKTIDPNAPVHSSAEAKAYLDSRYPAFTEELDRIISHTSSLNSRFKTFEDVYTNFNLIMSSKEGKNFLASNKFSAEYVTQKKLEQQLKAQQVPNIEATLASMNQGMQDSHQAYSQLSRVLSSNIGLYGAMHESVCESYLNLAEAYRHFEDPYDYRNYEKSNKAMECFQKAVNIHHNLPHMDSLLIARLYNSYGKLLMDKRQYKAALDCFRKAERGLYNASEPHSRLNLEISENLKVVTSKTWSDLEGFFGNCSEFLKTSMRQRGFGKYGDPKSFYSSFDRFSKDYVDRFTFNVEQFNQKMNQFVKDNQQRWSSFKKGNTDQWKNDNRTEWYHKKEHWSPFRSCHGHNWFKWGNYHHNKHWNSFGYNSCNRSFGSFHKHDGYRGPFYRIRRMFRIMFKVIFYSIVISLGIKIYKFFNRNPKEIEQDGDQNSKYQSRWEWKYNKPETTQGSESQNRWGWSQDRSEKTEEPTSKKRWGWGCNKSKVEKSQEQNTETNYVADFESFKKQQQRNDDAARRNDIQESINSVIGNKRAEIIRNVDAVREQAQQLRQEALRNAEFAREQAQQMRQEARRNGEAARERAQQMQQEALRNAEAAREHAQQVRQEAMRNSEELRQRRNRVAQRDENVHHVNNNAQTEGRVVNSEVSQSIQNSQVSQPEVDHTTQSRRERKAQKRMEDMARRRAELVDQHIDNVNGREQRENVRPTQSGLNGDAINVRNPESENQGQNSNWLVFGICAVVSTLGLVL